MLLLLLAAFFVFIIYAILVKKFFVFSPVCAVDSGVDFAMDEDEEYN